MSFEKEFEHLQISLKDIKLATNNFGDDHCIGRGGFGKVYKGELLLLCGLVMVAIKRLDSTLGQGAPEFWKEIMMLSLYKHENIVALLGFCNEDGESILVYEYMSRKSLDLYIKTTYLCWEQRLRICIGAARGLQYLHDPNGTERRVLHRDIKSANILLDENWNAKISDFGLSKVGPANQQYSFLISNAVGTFGYCDPMYINTGCLTKESDIYSFGVVLFEVLCGRFSLENHDNASRFLSVLAQRSYEEGKLDTIIKSDLKETISKESLERFSAIAYQCLHEDHTKRPQIAEIVNELQLALEDQIPTVKIKRTIIHKTSAVYSVDIHPTKPWVMVTMPATGIYVLNYDSLEMVTVFCSGKYENVSTAKFIAHKEWIVMGKCDGFILVVDYNTEEIVVELKAHTDVTSYIVVHPSRPYILSASKEASIKLWDWENDWKCIRIFKGHTDCIGDLKFNLRDPNIFASTSLDGTLKTWNIGDSSPQSSTERTSGLNCVDFLTIDEELYLVSATELQSSAMVLRSEDGTCIQTLEGHDCSISSVLCINHSNNDYIITGSKGETVSVWNAKTYELEHEITTEVGMVRAIEYRKESAMIIIGCEKGWVFGQLISKGLSCRGQNHLDILYDLTNEMDKEF